LTRVTLGALAGLVVGTVAGQPVVGRALPARVQSAASSTACLGWHLVITARTSLGQLLAVRVAT